MPGPGAEIVFTTKILSIHPFISKAAQDHQTANYTTSKIHASSINDHSKNHLKRDHPSAVVRFATHKTITPANEPAAAEATSSSTVSSPTTTPKKWQQSSSIDGSGDEIPKQQRKKEKLCHHTGSNICRMDEGVLDCLHKVQPQLLKNLRVYHNFREVSGQNVEDPQNFPNAWVTSVIRKGRGSEGATKMLGEANEALGPSAIIKDDLHSCKGLVGRVPVVLHPSLYRAVKLTFPRDIGGLAHDDAITNEMATVFMSQTISVLTPAMFSLGTQPL